MANEVLVKDGTAVCWADTTDYNPAAGVVFARTHQIDLTGVASTEAREGAKADLGATRAAGYSVHVGVEVDVVPVAGTYIEVFWAASYSGTAALGNPAGTTGSDADWAGTTHGTVAQAKRQLILIGTLVMTPDDDTDNVQRACINGYFSPPTRYGFPVVVDLAGQALFSDAVEMYIALVPVTDEVQ